jgi:tetratricopeptide (TPR) repeat protein
MADFLAADVAARRAVAAGRPDAALAVLEQAGRRVPFQPSDLSPFLAFAQTRFLRAELLARAGREREALAWYRTIGEVPIWDWAYLAPAELRQGEILERLGDRARAERHYARAVALWHGADPSLQPLVREARLALDRLRAEGRR